MGEQSAPSDSGKVRAAVEWLIKHRKKVIGAAIVALPLVARFVPDFPTEGVIDVLRVFLGA